MHRISVAAAVLIVSACSDDTGYQSLVYDSCFSVNDCVEAASLCEELAVEFGGLEYLNAICTRECAEQGPLSLDCPRAYVGRLGSCYPSSVGGGIDDARVCFEPCDFDDDCLVGFRCLSASDLCGNAEQCPIAPSDAICVPGPG
jgi:hypothetical protein